MQNNAGEGVQKETPRGTVTACKGTLSGERALQAYVPKAGLIGQ